MSKDVTFHLKVVINKQKTRVLFAEVDNDFADVLFSFLILPMGSIVQAMEKHYGDKALHGVGSLNTLYHGLSDLLPFGFKYSNDLSILKLESAYGFPFLNHKIDCNRKVYLSPEIYFVVLRVFTQKEASFIICDDLKIVPNGNGSIVNALKRVGVEMSDLDGAETRNVTFGLNEIMNFLKGLLISGQPLTDIILGGTVLNSQTGISSLHQFGIEATSYDLKLMLQKSTKKLLFAQAGKDFVIFLSTILAIILGDVNLHLGGNTSLYKIRYLYRRLFCLIDPDIFNTTNAKDCQMKSETQFDKHITKLVSDHCNAVGSRMYMVTDDLFVTRLSASSALSLLNRMEISSSDVEEVDLQIGPEEARNILRASLTSTSALSDGLASFLL